MLKINELRTGYNGGEIVHGISLEVPDEKIVAIVGGNGAGKSTLIKAITGLIPTTSGTVEFDGEKLTGLAPDKIMQKGVCLVPEGRQLFPNMTVEENLELFAETWGDILACAEENKVKIAIENCPMLFGREQWPGGQNLAVSPDIWRRMFEIFPSEYFGLNYDPSHFVWQQMDYIKPVYEFRDKIFHVHFKDIKVYQSKLDDVGTLAYPLEYMAPKLPGLGDVKWDRFVSALTDIGYDGYACIEVEDRSFEGNTEDVRRSLMLSKKYMEQFVI